MASDIRTVIDFATGDNWEMPARLYEKYVLEVQGLKATGKDTLKGQTAVQYWLSTLAPAERITVIKKGN